MIIPNVFEGEPYPRRISITIDKKKLMDRIGIKTMPKFFALLDAVNRLTTLKHFISLNYRDDQTKKKISFNRNLFYCVSFSMGVLYEAYLITEDIINVEDNIPDKKFLDKIVEIEKIFKQSNNLRLLRIFRNQLSFHIDICNICNGLADDKSDTIVLFEADSMEHNVDAMKNEDVIYKYAYEMTLFGFLKTNWKVLSKLLDSSNIEIEWNENNISAIIEKLFIKLEEIQEQIKGIQDSQWKKYFGKTDVKATKKRQERRGFDDARRF